MNTYRLISRNSRNEASFLRDVSPCDYQTFLSLNHELSSYREFDRAWRILYVNMSKQAEVMQALQSNIFGEDEGQTSIHDETIQRALNVELFNVLSSFYFYFSQFCETNFVRKYGKESDEIRFLTNLRREYYDAYFEYRFFYKLRNYAVHCGLPIQIAKKVERSGMAIWFDIKSLLASFDKWGPLKKELKEFEVLPVNTLSINFTKVVLSLQRELDSYLRQMYFEYAEKFVELVGEIDLEDNTIHLVELTQDSVRQGKGLQIDLASHSVPRILEPVHDAKNRPILNTLDDLRAYMSS